MQDERDHQNLLDTLVNQVIPLYYDRDSSGLPRKWIAMQKAAMRSLGWRFNADRMVVDYVETQLPAGLGRTVVLDAACVSMGRGQAPAFASLAGAGACWGPLRWQKRLAQPVGVNRG